MVPVEVELKNDGPDDVLMVGVLDGSEGGVRYPQWLPAIVSDTVGRITASRDEDPLVSPLRASDFVRLAPGTAFDPTKRCHGAAYLPLSTFATFAPPAPGTYRFQLVLSTESESPEQWLGRFNQDETRDEALELVLRVPRVTLESNTLEVRVDG
jgi:hypothetical protein